MKEEVKLREEIVKTEEAKFKEALHRYELEKQMGLGEVMRIPEGKNEEQDALKKRLESLSADTQKKKKQLERTEARLQIREKDLALRELDMKRKENKLKAREKQLARLQAILTRLRKDEREKQKKLGL